MSFKDWATPKLFSYEFRALLKPLLLGVVGIGAVQFNSALDAIFARLADPEGPAFLWYAIRIQHLPMALFGIALSSALLPSLSRTEDPARRRELLNGALKQAAALMLVCTFGIFSLAIPGVNLLYGHGSFTEAGVWETSRCLWAYGLGAIPSVFVLLLAANCYAEKNYRIPTLASLLAVALNIGLNALFVFGFGWSAVSIALATSLSSFLNMAILSKDVFALDFWKFFTQMALACALPAGIIGGLQIVWTPSRDSIMQLLQFGALSSIYMLATGLLAWRFGLKELFNLFRRGSYQTQ